MVAGFSLIVILLTMEKMLPKIYNRPSQLSESDLQNYYQQKTNHHPQSSVNINTVNMPSFRIKNEDFLAQKLPENILIKAKEVKDEQKRIKIMDVDTFYREANPPEGTSVTKLTLVLLHGMNFKSQTWVELGTFGLLAALGHRVIAFDLPGYGNTPGEKIPEQNRGSFLNEALELLHVKNPVFISPSMSGSFSLPFIFQFKDILVGYIPVAPIFTEKFTDEQYQSVNIPTLIIYGELDEQLGEISTTNLSKFSNNQVRMLPGAKHPAYLDQPELFHQLVFNFLAKLNSHL
ncbi:Protein abhd14b [Chamberlinius hualienensis]